MKRRPLTTGSFRHTKKQHELMRLVLEAADAGAFITAGELHQKLSYGPGVTVYAVYSSIDGLVQHGFIQPLARRTSRKEEIKPTLKAYGTFRGAA